MKKYILIIIFFAIGMLHLNANNFEIKPVIIDFQGVESFGDTVVAYGNFGSMLISYDNCATWQQVKIFQYGDIVGIFKQNDKMISFGSKGNIGVSTDAGNIWQTSQLVGDTILAALQYPDGFFLRTQKEFLTVNNNLEVENRFEFESNAIAQPNQYVKITYLKSLANFKNKLIAEIDSSNFLIFDYSLNIQDTMSFNNLGVFDTSFSYVSGYWLDSDSDNLYIKVLGRLNPHGFNERVYTTSDLQSIKDSKEIGIVTTMFRVSANTYYQLDKKEQFLVDTTKVFNSSSAVFPFKINDFTVSNGKMIVVGEGKLIETLNLTDSSLTVISNAQDYSLYFPPDFLDSDSYLFYSGDGYEYFPYFYRTDNDGITFSPVLEKDSLTKLFNSITPRFRFKINIGSKIYFGGYKSSSTYGSIFESSDTCQSFLSTQMNILFSDRISAYYLNAHSAPNIQIRNQNYITSSGPYLSAKSQTVYNIFYTLDHDFNVTNLFVDSIGAVDYVYSKDTNSFLVHCADAKDSVSEILYTTNHGAAWDTLARYPKNEAMLDYKEIYIKNKYYVAFIHYDLTTPGLYTASIDILDPETKEVNRICHWEPESSDENYGIYGVGICSDSNMVYIAFQDTLFYVPDLFNKSTWKYFTLPNNGRIVQPIKKFGNRFFARYTDNDIPWGTGIFWIKPLDTTMSHIDVQTETSPYFYAYPPFPLPAENEVRTLIYWDNRIDIGKDDIGVYDIYGTKIAGSEQLYIDKLNSYSGYLVWDCNGVESGVYLIHVKHGTTNAIIKVIVSR